MCFLDDDYDWHASFCEDKHVLSGLEAKCYECGAVIESGRWRREIFMQEYDECQVCEFEMGEPCGDGNHDYGETFECSICHSCCLVLRAIHDLEIEEGCPEHQSQPAFGELQDTIWHEPRYAHDAVRRFPELIEKDFVRRVIDCNTHAIIDKE